MKNDSIRKMLMVMTSGDREMTMRNVLLAWSSAAKVAAMHQEINEQVEVLEDLTEKKAAMQQNLTEFQEERHHLAQQLSQSRRRSGVDREMADLATKHNADKEAALQDAKVQLANQFHE